MYILLRQYPHSNIANPFYTLHENEACQYYINSVIAYLQMIFFNEVSVLFFFAGIILLIFVIPEKKWKYTFKKIQLNELRN